MEKRVDLMEKCGVSRPDPLGFHLRSVMYSIILLAILFSASYTTPSFSQVESIVGNTYTSDGVHFGVEFSIRPERDSPRIPIEDAPYTFKVIGTEKNFYRVMLSGSVEGYISETDFQFGLRGTYRGPFFTLIGKASQEEKEAIIAQSPVKIVQRKRIVRRPFDETASSISPGHKGDDFVRLYKTLSITPKGEFETTEAYERRKRALPSGIYAFVLPSAAARYQADEHEFVFRIEKTSYRSLDFWKPRSSMFVLNEKREVMGSYIGSNAFGVKKLIKRVNIRMWGVVHQEDWSRDTEIKLSIDPTQAREMKSRLKVIGLFWIDDKSVPDRLTSKHFPGAENATAWDYSGATIDAPTDLTTYYYGIQGQPLCFIIYDQKSGRILGKNGPQSGSVCDEPPEQTQ
jgi:hypothetical protein